MYLSKQITAQEAKLSTSQQKNIEVGNLVATIIERIAFEARESEYVDSKSGVSARLTISAYENLLKEPTAERLQDLTIYIPAGPRLGDIVVESQNVSLLILSQ